MTNVIQIVRYVEISQDEVGLYAREVSTHGINKPGETYEEYSKRMEYHECELPPNYPVPAVVSHLNLIAAKPLQGWEDFKAIGWHGRV